MASDTPAAQPATLPAAAVQAAAIEAATGALADTFGIGLATAHRYARKALAAAAPHLAAAERERMLESAEALAGLEAGHLAAEREQAGRDLDELVNDLLTNTPESFGDDVAPQVIAIRWVRHLEGRVDELHALAADMLSRFVRTDSGHRARAGQVQVAKWQAVLDGDGRG